MLALLAIQSIINVEQPFLKMINDQNQVHEDVLSLFISLKQLYQKYTEVLELLDPNQIPNILEEELKTFISKDKLISVNSWEDLCLPILDIYVDFVFNHIFEKLAKLIVEIVSKNTLLEIHLNSLKILVSFYFLRYVN